MESVIAGARSAEWPLHMAGLGVAENAGDGKYNGEAEGGGRFKGKVRQLGWARSGISGWQCWDGMGGAGGVPTAAPLAPLTPVG